MTDRKEYMRLYYLRHQDEVKAKYQPKTSPRGNVELMERIYKSIKAQPGHFGEIAKRVGLPNARMYTIMPSMEEAGYLLAEDPRYGILSVFEE